MYSEVFTRLAKLSWFLSLTLLVAIRSPAAGEPPAPLQSKLHRGGISIGSWNTSVQFQQIVVRTADRVLYESDFATEGTNGWRIESGTWSAQDGVLQQTDRNAMPAYAHRGDSSWSDYTVELRARKVSGDEGFLISVNVGATPYNNLNLGGWGNTASAIEQNVNGVSVILATINHRIEENVWYDIRIVVKGPKIECYLDSVLLLATSHMTALETGRRGAIGVGSWATSVDFKDILVTSNGVTLYKSDFEAQGTNGWQFFNGQWSVRDGALHQANDVEWSCRAIFGDTSWANYTLSLKARKTGGLEGFMIYVNWLDNRNALWLNLGGWTNTLASLEQDLNGTRVPLGEMVPMQIDPDVWYDIKVVVNGPEITCYVNSQLIRQEHASTLISTNVIFLSASKTLDNHVLQFQIGNKRFNGILPLYRGTPAPMERGSLVNVTGISRAMKPSESDGDSEAGFLLMLPSADSIVVLQPPTFWTPQRLLWVGGLFLGTLLFAAAWVVMVLHKNRLLKIAQAELQKTNEELESRVQQRTAALARANSDLKHEQDLFLALLENASDNIYFKDLESRFVRCSQSMCARAGLTHEQIVGKTSADIFHAEYARKAMEDEQEIIRTGKPLIGKMEQEIHADQRTTWVLTTKMPWRDPKGNIIGTFGISRDITAIKEAEARLTQVHKQLVDASRMAGQAEVATSVLHNIGNVLNSLNVSTNIIEGHIRKSRVGASIGRVINLLADYKENLAEFFRKDSRAQKLPTFFEALSKQTESEQQEMLSEIKSLTGNVDHIKQIVAMQQNYARIMGHVEPQSIPSLVDDAMMVNAAGLESAQIRVVRKFEEVLKITVDKHRVLQVLVNLISNATWALSHSTASERVLTLTVEIANEGSMRVSVADNGIGISEENLSKLFKHGFTTRKEGHGFGLHNSILIAREMGGNLHAQSEGLGRGAVFTLELPTKQVTEGAELETSNQVQEETQVLA